VDEAFVSWPRMTVSMTVSRVHLEVPIGPQPILIPKKERSGVKKMMPVVQ
jgi:hypothetical protein